MKEGSGQRPEPQFGPHEWNRAGAETDNQCAPGLRPDGAQQWGYASTDGQPPDYSRQLEVGRWK